MKLSTKEDEDDEDSDRTIQADTSRGSGGRHIGRNNGRVRKIASSQEFHGCETRNAGAVINDE